MGWQSIALAGGTAAALSLGEQGHLPIPIAVTMALTIACWGLLNLIDASYWATRAIGFLANVEAVYFSEADLEKFHPYIARHPPLKMMDSLKYQALAIVGFIGITVFYFGWKVLTLSQGTSNLPTLISSAPWYKLVYWCLPVIFGAPSAFFVINARRKSIEDYQHFVNSSPGPGLVKNAQVFRTVLLEDIADANLITTGKNIQRALAARLAASLGRWKKGSNCSLIGMISVLVGVGWLVARRSFGEAGIALGITAAVMHFVWPFWNSCGEPAD
jgi:hypothetical protein